MKDIKKEDSNFKVLQQIFILLFFTLSIRFFFKFFLFFAPTFAVSQTVLMSTSLPLKIDVQFLVQK